MEKGRPTPFHHSDGPGMSVQEILIPASKAGLVIGKGGETIKQLQVSELDSWSDSFVIVRTPTHKSWVLDCRSEPASRWC